MDFEWDEAKAASNLRKHRLTLAAATEVFTDPQRTDVEDARRPYDEQRRITVGVVQGRVCVVVYTRRGEVTRMISARKANKREVRSYGKR